jgi:hypothetical protein
MQDLCKTGKDFSFAAPARNKEAPPSFVLSDIFREARYMPNQMDLGKAPVALH